MRTETCLTCGATFNAPHRHPMIEEAWCPECLVIVRECVVEYHGVPYFHRVTAMRPEEV